MSDTPRTDAAKYLVKHMSGDGDSYYAVKADVAAQLEIEANRMDEALEKIASFAPGNGDVCEMIAKIARVAMRREWLPST